MLCAFFWEFQSNFGKFCFRNRSNGDNDSCPPYKFCVYHPQPPYNPPTNQNPAFLPLTAFPHHLHPIQCCLFPKWRRCSHGRKKYLPFFKLGGHPVNYGVYKWSPSRHVWNTFSLILYLYGKDKAGWKTYIETQGTHFICLWMKKGF